MSRSVGMDYDTLRNREHRYSKGGYIPVREELPRVMVREVDGRKEYYEPFVKAWVPALTMAEWQELKVDG